GRADDVGGCRGDEPIRARPPGPLAHCRRLVRRHPALCTALGLLAAIALLAALLWLRKQLEVSPPPWEDVEQELARGRLDAVTVIGQSGKPPRIRWLVWEGTAREPRAADDPFAFDTGTLSLLEMVRTSPPQGYRFSAEIRHDESPSPAGYVGLFFGYSKNETRRATHQLFCEVVFADRGGLAGAF